MAAPRLKVYATRIGFHDAIVAAPNQKAALAAWDVRENLFQQERAEVTEEPDAVEAALAHPGVVLRRPAGSDAPFAETPGLPEVPKLSTPKRAGKAKAAAPKTPKPDRRPLDEAEAALAAFDAEARDRMAEIERRRRDLEVEARTAQRETEVERRRLEKARDRAREAYERQVRG
jgi:hypothetical protein